MNKIEKFPGDSTLVDEEGKVIYGPCHNMVPDGKYIRVDIREVENEGKDNEEANHFWGLIDFDGNEVLEPKYQFIERFENGYARVKIGGFFGLIDEKCNFVVTPSYRDLGKYTPNGMYALQGIHYGVIKIVGGRKEIVVPFKYKHVRTDNKGITTLFDDDIDADDVINL